MMVGYAIIILIVAGVCFGDGNPESCLRFGGGGCCQVLHAIDRPIHEDAAEQPLYIVFLPNNEESINVDNDCLTFFPVPDDPVTYITYISRVFNDGSNEIKSYILSEPELGVRRLGGALCAFTDTTFDNVECDNTIFLSQRCHTFGDCRAVHLVGPPSGVQGFSTVRRPISRACLNKAKADISNNGIPDDDFIILPMKLPSKCVLNQVCTVASNLQMFCQTVGVTIPTVNNNVCVNPYY